jgi:hypothetical protein
MDTLIARGSIDHGGVFCKPCCNEDGGAPIPTTEVMTCTRSASKRTVLGKSML